MAVSLTPELTPEKVTSVIGASFGLVFVLANSDSLPAAGTAGVRILGIALFAVVIGAAVAGPGSARTGTRDGPRPDRAFALIALAESAAIFGGIAVLRALDRPEAGVAWVSLVVGVHFLALARHWTEAVFTWLGATLTPLGLAGLVLAAAGADEAAIDVVAGIGPGLVLLTAALWGVGVRPGQRGARARSARR